MSVFNQSFTISDDKVSTADLQLELYDLRLDLFYQGRIYELNFTPKKTLSQHAKVKPYDELNAGKHVPLQKQLLHREWSSGHSLLHVELTSHKHEASYIAVENHC